MRRFKITVDDRTYDVAVEEIEDDVATTSDSISLSAPTPTVSGSGSARIAPPVAPSTPAPAKVATGSNDVVSPLSGTVVEIHVPVGHEVQRGDRLITLEAMKMNTAVSAPRGGGVKSIEVQVGAAVQEGQVLLTLS